MGSAWKQTEAFHRTDRDRDVPWLAPSMTLIPTSRRTGWVNLGALFSLIGLNR